MTLRQIMQHKRTGLTVKVNGQDGKITNVDEPNSKVTVALFSGCSLTVSFYEVTTEWAGEWTPPGRIVADVAWVAEEAGKPAPVITRTVETDVRTRQKYTVVRIDGWVV